MLGDEARGGLHLVGDDRVDAEGAQRIGCFARDHVGQRSGLRDHAPQPERSIEPRHAGDRCVQRTGRMGSCADRMKPDARLPHEARGIGLVDERSPMTALHDRSRQAK